MSALARFRGYWPALLLASSAAVALLVYGDADSAARLPVVLWFVLVCPGTALIRLLRLEDPVAELAIGAALSAALAVIVSGTMLYAGAWSPKATLGVLVGVTVLGAIVDMKRAPSSVHPESVS
jgi:hypothetical protein